MTLSNRSRFADEKSRHRFAQESVLCMDGQKGSARPGSIHSFFAGIHTNQVQVQGKRKESVTLLSSDSFSLPCGGLSGVYGGSDQSRDEEKSFPIFH